MIPNRTFLRGYAKNPTLDRLVREPGGVIIAARLQVKGGSFRDLPLTKELSDSLEQWFAFLAISARQNCQMPSRGDLPQPLNASQNQTQQLSVRDAV